MKIRNNQKGLVSLLTVVILSLLLLIFVVGMTIIVINLQRQATNASLSVKAYYAAENNVEEAVLSINKAVKDGTAIPYGSNCVSGSDVCQTITQGAAGSVTETAKANEANQYEIKATDSLTKIVIEWSNNADGVGDVDGYSPSKAGNFATGAAWNFPAMMELVDVGFTTSDNTMAGTVTSDPVIRTALIEPLSSGTGSSTITAAQPVGGKCNTSLSPDYYCSATITGFNSSMNHIIRLRPRYAKTSYRITFYRDATNLIASSVDNKATIDVTAKVGDVSRRVTARVLVSQGTLSGLDYAIFGDDRICKDFSVLVTSTTVEQAEAGTCPL